jgi:hypothetical protein
MGAGAIAAAEDLEKGAWGAGIGGGPGLIEKVEKGPWAKG